MNQDQIRLREDETFNEYIYRLYSYKDDNRWTWKDMANIVYEQTGVSILADTLKHRVNYAKTKLAEQEYEQQQSDISDDSSILASLRAEKYKIADERTQVNALYRRMAREDTIKEIAADFARVMSEKKLLDYATNTLYNHKDKSAILCISDIHYGLEVNSSFNRYNTEIAKRRITELRDKVIRYINKENINDLYIVNLGDLIAGRIHTTIRLNSRIDVVTQTMEISEILAEFMATLSHYANIYYTSTSDNHSRIEPKKSESLELESLVRITDWYLKDRCKDFVKFVDDNLSEDLASFKVGKYNIICTHGDKDKPSNAIQNLRLLTGINYDICLLAHRHHFSADEYCGTTLIANGCICGTDQFAQDLRLHSKPSQNMIVIGEDNPVECIYKIVLE